MGVAEFAERAGDLGRRSRAWLLGEGTGRGWRQHLGGVPVAFGLVIVAGAFLRLHRLAAESYWLDEATSVDVVTTMGAGEILLDLPRNDPHPPLYYLLLDGWVGLFGASEASTRLLSALLGIATIVVLYAVASRLFDRRVGTTSALLLAVSPLHVWYAQDARMYALVALLAAASFYAMLRLDDGRRYGVLYVVATVLLAYSHVYGLFFVLAQNIYVGTRLLAVRRSRPSLRRWIALQSLVVVFAAPWLGLLAHRAFFTADGLGSISWIATPTVETLQASFYTYLSGHLDLRYPTILPAAALVSLALALVGSRRPRFDPAVGRAVDRALSTVPDSTPRGEFAAAFRREFRAAFEREFGSSSVRDALGRVRRANRNPTYLLALWLVVPIAVPYLLSHLVTPIYVTRYTLGASLAFYVLLAKGVHSVSRTHLRYFVLGLLVLGLVAPLPTYYAEDQKEQWREAADLVAANADPGALVLLNRPYVEKPFAYYFDRRDVTVERLPDDATRGELVEQASGYDDVWVVFSYASSGMRRGVPDVLANDASYAGPTTQSYLVGIELLRFEREPDNPENSSQRSDEGPNVVVVKSRVTAPGKR